MSDPLSEAVEAAVARAITAQIPSIIDAVRAGLPLHTPEADRFIKLNEAAGMLGHSPSSLKRHQRNGTLPPGEKVGGKCGYRATTVKAILENLGGKPTRKVGRRT